MKQLCCFAIITLCSILGINAVGFSEFFVGKNKFTLSNTGCPCWFDLEGDLLAANSCACCKDGARQCGYPKHKLCHKTGKPDIRRGCQGVDESKYTLSEIGHPCHFDPTRKDCAWCAHDGVQCGNFTKLPRQSYKHGRYCKKFNKNHKQCYGSSQDCRNFPELCDQNASCVNTKVNIFRKWTKWACACNPGFIGNGLTCVETSTGVKPQSIPPQMDLEVIMTSQFVIAPQPNAVEVLGPQDDNLLDEMEDMLDTGILCSGCSNPVATCNA